MFVLVLPKGLNDNLLALDVDAHAVVGYWFVVPFEFFTFFYDLIAIKSCT
jgi:hypothetical protein